MLSDINKYEPSAIAEKIKKECIKQGITIRDMLQGLNINHAAITKMSNGGAPSYITLARICDYLNISIDTLLDRTVPASIPMPPDLDAAIETVASAAGVSADYVRGAMRLPPCNSTNDNAK